MARKYGTVATLAVILTMILASQATATSLVVTLSQNTETVVQGTTVVAFDGTILNPSTTDRVYLNGDSSSTSSPLVSVDDNPFLSNPSLIFLDPLQSSGLVALFNVDLPPNIGTGIYSGTFSILGGSDGGTSTDFFDLGDASFSVRVTSTPEPSIILLWTATLAGIGLFRITSSGMRRRRLCSQLELP